MIQLTDDCLVSVFHYASSYELIYIYKLVNLKWYKLLNKRADAWKYIILRFSTYILEKNVNIITRHIICTSRIAPLVSKIELDFHQFRHGGNEKKINTETIIKTLVNKFSYLKSLYIKSNTDFSYNEILNLILHSKSIKNVFINNFACIGMNLSDAGRLKSLRSVSFPNTNNKINPELVTICTHPPYRYYTKQVNYEEFELWTKYVLQFPSLTELHIPPYTNKIPFIDKSHYLVNVLKHTPNLRKLELNTPFVFETYAVFSTLTTSCVHLEELKLNGSLLNVINMMYLQTLPNLHTISYMFDTVWPVHDRIYENLTNMKQLKHLNILNCSWLTLHQLNILYSSSLIIFIEQLGWSFYYAKNDILNMLSMNFHQVRKLYLSNFRVLNEQFNIIIEIMNQCHLLDSIHVHEIDNKILKALCQRAKQWKNIETRTFSEKLIKPSLFLHFLYECTELETLMLGGYDTVIYDSPAIYPDKLSIFQLRERLQASMDKYLNSNARFITSFIPKQSKMFLWRNIYDPRLKLFDVIDYCLTFYHVEFFFPKPGQLHFYFLIVLIVNYLLTCI